MRLWVCPHSWKTIAWIDTHTSDDSLADEEILRRLAVAENSGKVRKHYAQEVCIRAGEFILFRGDLVHAGAGYAQPCYRVHYYLLPPGMTEMGDDFYATVFLDVGGTTRFSDLFTMDAPPAEAQTAAATAAASQKRRAGAAFRRDQLAAARAARAGVVLTRGAAQEEGEGGGDEEESNA